MKRTMWRISTGCPYELQIRDLSQALQTLSTRLRVKRGKERTNPSAGMRPTKPTDLLTSLGMTTTRFSLMRMSSRVRPAPEGIPSLEPMIAVLRAAAMQMKSGIERDGYGKQLSSYHFAEFRPLSFIFSGIASICIYSSTILCRA
jgi:hypothetical protein